MVYIMYTVVGKGSAAGGGGDVEINTTTGV